MPLPFFLCVLQCRRQGDDGQTTAQLASHVARREGNTDICTQCATCSSMSLPAIGHARGRNNPPGSPSRRFLPARSQVPPYLGYCVVSIFARAESFPWKRFTRYQVCLLLPSPPKPIGHDDWILWVGKGEASQAGRQAFCHNVNWPQDGTRWLDGWSRCLGLRNGQVAISRLYQEHPRFQLDRCHGIWP